MREIVLDIETTGLDAKNGDRIIEIACLELINHIPTEKYYHTYVNPDEKEISPGALKVHGITNNFLSDKPKFNEIVDDFFTFIIDSPLLAHNASFDIGFLNHELKLINMDPINDDKVIDTLKLARAKHPGMSNNLDALCKRYNISEQKRDLHDAKSDCELLAQVYIELRGGRQRSLHLSNSETQIFEDTDKKSKKIKVNREIYKITGQEIENHNKFIKTFQVKSLWEEYKKKDG